MNYLKQVERGIEFIEERLDQDIDLAEIARHAGISRWHFQRIFKALTNETLKGYIRSRRLSNSLAKLMYSKERILEIALAAGYDSQESFTRAFKQTFDVTPSEYRRMGDKSMFLRKVQIDEQYLRRLRQGVSLTPTLTARPKMLLVGLHTRFFSVDSEKNNIASQLPRLWEAFLPLLGRIPNRVGNACYGVIRQAPEDTDWLEYYAATEVSSAVRSDLVRVEVPASTYAHFAHRGPSVELDHTVNYVYSNWLLGSGQRHTYGPDLEIYGPEYHPTSPESVIYYAIPVTRGGAR